MATRASRRHSTVAPTVVSIVVAAAAAVALGACSDPAPEPAATDYTTGLEAICIDTASRLDEMPDPPDGITVNEFASQAAAILLDEAERIRSLRPPDELDDDHRALIRNGEEQADSWTALAAAVGSEAPLSDITTTISQLNLGRNDLVTEMGAPACVRLPG